MTTWYRIQPSDRDPQDLLRPEEQTSEPWDNAVRGRCDKCGGEGWTWHECASCKESGRDADCPSCSGELRYKDECPACEGTGTITDAQRDGVSVFPDEAGLYRYMIARDAELDDCVVVELEGEETDDEDFDADEGAVLVRPTKILAARGIDHEMVDEIRQDSAG